MKCNFAGELLTDYDQTAAEGLVVTELTCVVHSKLYFKCMLSLTHSWPNVACRPHLTQQYL